MKIIAQTKRGKLYIDEKESSEDKFALIADWQFFRGKIQPEEKLNFDDLKKGFIWSQKKGFIEEDSSIISTMIARGKKNGLSPVDSILKSDYLPTSSFKSIPGACSIAALASSMETGFSNSALTATE